MNRVIKIIESQERLKKQINFIVNSFRTDDEQRTEKLRDYLELLVQETRDDMIDIYNLNEE